MISKLATERKGVRTLNIFTNLCFDWSMPLVSACDNLVTHFSFYQQHNLISCYFFSLHYKRSISKEILIKKKSFFINESDFSIINVQVILDRDRNILRWACLLGSLKSKMTSSKGSQFCEGVLKCSKPNPLFKTQPNG